LQKAKVIVTATQAKGTLRYLESYESAVQLSKTNISITYFDGMDVLKTIGVSVEDNTVKLITALGAVGGAQGTIFAASAQQSIRPTNEFPIALPIVLDFSYPADFTFYGQEQCKLIGKPNAGYGYCFIVNEKEGRKTANDQNEMVTYDFF
jgi:hypothetical protein